jgi:ribonuclease T2
VRRSDAIVLSISGALATIVVAAVTFSLLVLEHKKSSSVFESEDPDSSLLSLSWAPSLCKTTPSAPGCKTGQVGQFGPTLILHGLWPQPFTNQYCGVTGQARKVHGSDLPPVQLREDVRKNLQSLISDAAVMVGHEWYAHGTCSGVTPDVYFSLAATLTEQVRKILDPLLQAAQGNRIMLSTVRGRFDAEFGNGAGARVRFECRNVIGEGNVISDVRLSLPSVLDLAAEDPVSLRNSLARAPTTPERCQRARVP